jgi:AcrR family transcriptional regulator
MVAHTDTKRKILELSQDAMRQKGYGGFSYADIASQLDIKNAAVHYHFPNKEDLGVALIQRERRRFAKWTARQAIRELDAWGKLNWFLGVYELYSHGGTRVCYLGALESNFDSLPVNLQEEARGLNTDLLNWLTQLIRAGKEKGSFVFSGSADAKAVMLLSAIQGAVQIARVSSPATFYAVVDQLKADLGFVSK